MLYIVHLQNFVSVYDHMWHVQKIKYLIEWYHVLFTHHFLIFIADTKRENERLNGASVARSITLMCSVNRSLPRSTAKRMVHMARHVVSTAVSTCHIL
jgi:hypothetical protein